MKTNSFFHLFFLMLCVVFGNSVMKAYDFEVDGIYYRIVGNDAQVTSKSDFPDIYSDYSGDISIPESVTFNGRMYAVTSIGGGAFYNCGNLYSVTIPSSVVSIGNSAFLDCVNLANIVIPNSVISVDNSAFGGTAWFENQPDGLVYAGLVAYKYKGVMQYGTEITIRDGTTSITNAAFHNCNGLTNVFIPNTVISIGYNAFKGCSGLTSVTIPNSVKSIGESAFEGCSSMKLLNFNAVACADFYSPHTPFKNLNISTVIIGNEVQRIPSYFVSNLKELTSVTIPIGVTSVGKGAFAGCTSLVELNFNAASCEDFNSSDNPFANTVISSITINDEVERIPAFFGWGLSTLRTVTIGNAVKTIGASAFKSCVGLSSITIPNSVTAMGSQAFYNCNGLEFVFSCADVPPVMESSDCFNCYNTATLYVPYEVLGTYKNTYYWNNFYKILGVNADGNVLVSDITLNETEKDLIVNQTYKLIATITPDVATNQTVSWSSSNPSIATVDSEGLVTAIAVGTATITATTTDGTNLSASCDVTVSIIPVTSVQLNKTSLTLDIGDVDTYQLTATVTPSNATYKTLAWTSSNPAVATVSDNGLVSLVAPGTATITATTTDGTNLSASCQVKVVKRIKSITLNESSLSLTLPETAQLTATITPSDAVNQVLNWTSSNTSVATVDSIGFITSKGVGTTTIKATTTDGSNLSASCTVTVNKQYVTSISLNESSMVMHIGDTFQLIADVQPENASNPTLNWSSGNTSVARVDNTGLVTAVAGGTTYIKASATDGSYIYANCLVQVLPDYYLTLDTLSHIRGESARVEDMQVSLINKNLISGIQFDVSLPDDVEFNLVDGMPDVTLDDARATRSHSIATSQLSNGKYRVLVTSSTSKDLKGHDGVLVHMNLLLPQMHNTGNAYVNISNIIASEADETGHTLNNTSAPVRFYYIVGDADANAVVDIADHTATASKILGRSPSPFYYDAANVDGNSSLNVVDLVGITNIALEIRPITVQQAPAVGFVENRLFCDKLKLNANNEAEIKVGMDCAFDFAGFQMDVTMPQGLALVDATLGEKASKLGLVTEVLPDGRIRILGTSFSDAEVDGACPQLLTLKVKAERNYVSGSQIEFSDILFAQRDLTSHCFDGLNVEYVEQSSVYELMNEARIYIEDGNIIVDTPVAGTVQIIAVDGRMVEYQAQVGHNVYAVGTGGIYVVNFNGKTIKVRL